MRQLNPIGVTVVLGLALMIPSAAASAAPASDTAKLVARGWAPWMVLAGSPPAGQALELMRQSLRIDDAVLNRLVLSPELKELSEEILDSLNDFDLGQLYEQLPENRKGWHSVAMAGRYENNSYHVRQIPVADLDTPLRKQGQMQALVSLYPVSDPRGTRYKALMRFQANVGPVGWDAVLDALHLGLLNVTQAAPVQPPRSAVNGVNTLIQSLSAAERRVLAQLWTAFPASFGWYAKFGTLSDFYIESDSSDRAKHIRVTFHLKRNALQAQYPAVAAYLEELGDFLTANVVVKGAQGRWLTASLDTKSLNTTVELWLADGELVPSRDGQPLFNQVSKGFPPSSNWRTIVSVDARALGVQVHIRDLVTRWRYDRVPKGAHISGLTSNTPDVRVEGRLLGVLPTDWVQGLSPVTIKETINDFMEVLVDSNDGEGARLIANFQAQKNHGSTLMLAASWDGLDNFFVRFGMGMVSERVIPSHEQAKGLRRLFTDGMTMFGRDLERWTNFMAKNPGLTTQN